METKNISASLKNARLQRGFSLSQLARRAGTSAPTVSRYENGWDRFELYTLQKLATALNCNLQIALVPATRAVSQRNMSELCRKIERLFWDRPLKVSDLTEYPGWVAKRVLEYGSLDDVMALRDTIGRDRFLEEIASLQFDSSRTRRFWQHMLEKEGIKCTSRFSRKAAQSCWRN
jgi:transcriptional regulator with XRE-family HTH domain